MNALKFLKSAFCFAWMPLYFGGSSESDSHTDTTNNTTNTAYNTDKRVVASDAAVALSGDGSSITKNETTSFADSSNRSTSFADNRSYTTTDFGSVSKSLDSVTMMGKAAVDLSDHSVSGAIDTLKKLADSNLSSVKAAFDAARGTSADSVRMADAAISFAKQTTDMTNQAFAEAKNGPDTNKTVMLAALGVIGVVGAAIVLKKKG